MIENRNLICIVCPAGCNLEVVMNGNGVSSVSGNGCKRGADYARDECTNPTRTLTTVVQVTDGKYPMAPVKTDRPIPKGLIFECMKSINRCKLRAPVKIGDTVIENILDTGANIIAAANVEEIH